MILYTYLQCVYMYVVWTPMCSVLRIYIYIYYVCFKIKLLTSDAMWCQPLAESLENDPLVINNPLSSLINGASECVDIVGGDSIMHVPGPYSTT